MAHPRDAAIAMIAFALAVIAGAYAATTLYRLGWLQEPFKLSQPLAPVPQPQPGPVKQPGQPVKQPGQPVKQPGQPVKQPVKQPGPVKPTPAKCEPRVDVDEDPKNPKLPDWAKQGAVWFPEMYKRNKQVVAATECFDFLLYGDSITMFHAQNPAMFKKHFGDKKAAALGIGGNTVEQLAWRIMSGQELPAVAPKCIAMLIGINNSTLGTFDAGARHLEELLRWLQRVFPSTKLVLVLLLPRTKRDVAPLNQRYMNIARRLGITFTGCGQGLDPTSPVLFSDGLHPTAAGHDRFLGCLRGVVGPYI